MPDRITVEGIDAPCDKDKLADMRFVLMLGDLDDEALADGEKLPVMSRLMRYLLGGERDSVMEALAEAHGGVLDAATFSKWLTAYLKEAGAKN